jgi:hypothetical protein
VVVSKETKRSKAKTREKVILMVNTHHWGKAEQMMIYPIN